ncbi:helix-turn-helix domain-containing protein [Parapedomonas caeni]
MNKIQQTCPFDLETIDVDIGKRIKKLRVLAGYSQTEVGKYLGLSFQQVQKYESGKNRISFGVAMAMTRLFKCSLEDLVPEAITDTMESQPAPDAELQGSAAEALFARRETVSLVRKYWAIESVAARQSLLEVMEHLGDRDAGHDETNGSTTSRPARLRRA